MRDTFLRRLLAAAALFASVAVHAAVDLPGALKPAAQDFRLIGSGRLTWFGLHVYDAALWSPARRVDFGQPFALALRYVRSFRGERIAERSVVEIERLGLGDAAKRAQWGAQMKRIFPDVQAGDTLTGVYRPGVGAEFFHRDVPVGTIDDPEFARAFFSIWLDERTREPKLRERLMGNR
jgi:hypothetical protein